MRSDIGVLALQGDFDAHRRALATCGAAARAVRLPSALEGLRGLILPGGESTTLLRLMGEYGFDMALPRFVSSGGALFGTCAGAILLARSVSSPRQWSLGLIDIAIERNGYGRQIDSFETELTDVAPEVLQAHAVFVEPSQPEMIHLAVLRPRAVSVEAPEFHCVQPSSPGADPAGLNAGGQFGAGRQGATGEPLAGGAGGGPKFLPGVFIRAPRIRDVGEGAKVLASHSGEPVLVRQGRLLVSTFHPELTADPRVHAYFTAMVPS